MVRGIKFENSIIVEHCTNWQTMSRVRQRVSYRFRTVEHSFFSCRWLCIFHTLSFSFPFTFSPVFQIFSIVVEYYAAARFSLSIPLFLFPSLTTEICKSCVRLSYRCSYVSKLILFISPLSHREKLFLSRSSRFEALNLAKLNRLAYKT